MNATVKILIAGANGQLGRELQRSAPDWAQVTACGRDRLDITQADQVQAVLADWKPDVVINAAAYTQVDRAESERDQAFIVNAEGACNLARAAAANNARIISVSTDFVFDGRAGRPYRTDDTPRPLGVYGASKYAGECAVRDAAPGNNLVVRTAWVYSQFGSNFVKSMLELLRTRPELGVVADQIGSPTWAAQLAAALWEMTQRSELAGVLHFTGAGVASWYDFAVAIRDEALARGLLDKRIPIKPLTTEQFPRPAARPASSVLDQSQTWQALSLPPKHWRQSLTTMLEELTEHAHA